METLEKKEAKAAKGFVFIYPEKCKGCGFCIEFCPSHVLEFSRDFNSKGYYYPVDVKADDCNGCDLCGLFCPDFSIYGARIKDLVEKGFDMTQIKGGIQK